jgi:hypothetical protein
VVQQAVPGANMPAANALILFANDLGAALAVSVAQNLFAAALRAQLGQDGPGIDVNAVLAAVPPPLVDTVRQAYSAAVQRAFLVPIVDACLAFVAVLGLGLLA